ncbi:protein-glutamate O-methyltransferase CheR [Sphingomonas sp. LaA6.9]|uniref:CheR family methyltransferase n=1 Tax=Sphingomonas sp. LaA6.9 TaxID=2919914 RepID=UPI001F4F651F|nr:protein-glutamate O-methyltransferase [Sphingomonas sp. LaA6.9]MCJ8158681.1 protein-glutamate O-methyltransferase [Sphingomonas sp. LaA6.9]
MKHSVIPVAGEAPEPSTLAATAELGLSEFRAIAAIMQEEARIHLVESKMTLVHSRLSRRLREHGLTRFADYVALVHNDPVEREAMVVALTTNHTHFFRENHHFDHLREKLLPALQGRARIGRPVRIWSAGCSSGEEVYSIAMCLAGDAQASAGWLRQGDVKLLATDIAPHVVDSVARGVYSAATVEPIPASYRSRWLKPEGDGYAVAEELRSLVTARVLNLFDPWPMRQKYDAIFCRNVMIYFDDVAKAELEARFVDMLAPGGFLYIGHSERLIGAAAGVMEPVGQTIYVKPGARND